MRILPLILIIAIVAIACGSASTTAHAAQIPLNVGTTNNDGTGDPLRLTFQKIGSNLTTLFSLAQTNGLAQLGLSNANVKPVLAQTLLGTNTAYALQAGTNLQLSMTATTVVFSVRTNVQGEILFEDDVTFDDTVKINDGLHVMIGGAHFANPVFFTNSATFLGAIGNAASNRPLWLDGSSKLFGATNNFVLAPGGPTSLSNFLAALPSQTEALLGAGLYSVPLLGSGPDDVRYSLLIANRSNLVLRGYGAKLSNNNHAVMGNMLMLSNVDNVTIEGLEFDGGAIVDTNTQTPACVALDGRISRVTFRDCTFRNNIKGIKTWFGAASISNILVDACLFEKLGDTNWPGVGGALMDGSGVESWGANTKVLNSTFHLCARGVEIYNYPNELPFSLASVENCTFKNTTGDFPIWLLTDNHTTQLRIHGNMITNQFGVRRSDLLAVGIHVQSGGAYSAIVTENHVAGDFTLGILWSATLRFSTIAKNHIRATQEGMRIAGANVQFNNIIDNLVEHAGWRGIWLNGQNNVLAGNLVRNVSTNTAFGAGSAIYIEAGTNNFILNNVLIDDQSTVTTDSGIELDTGATLNWISGNYFNRLPTNVHNLAANNRVAPRLVLEGSATLASGLATVTTPWVGANSRILLTPRATANPVNALTVTNVVNGASFDIRSASNSDANRVDWLISEPQ